MTGDSLPLALPLADLATADAESAGDEATLLYRELRKPLLRYLVSLGLSHDEAQDVVQDAFLWLHRHLAAGGSQQNIRGWVFRVAHNHARNRQNSYDRRFSAPLDAVSAVADQVTPEQAALDKELDREKFQRLRKALGLLDPAARECLLLRAGGLCYREIGEVLGIPTSTVADTVSRAVKKLAEKYNV